MNIEGINCRLSETHISNIKAGDTVLIDGKLKTVHESNIKHCSFMGLSLFGDSYQLGYKPVIKAEIFKAV